MINEDNFPGFVYIFRNSAAGEPLYVGSTCDIRQRMMQHFLEKPRGRTKLSENYDRVGIVYYAQVHRLSDARRIERFLIKTYKPIFNTRYDPSTEYDREIYKNNNLQWKWFIVSEFKRDTGILPSRLRNSDSDLAADIEQYGCNLGFFVDKLQQTEHTVSVLQNSIDSLLNYMESVNAILCDLRGGI